MSKTIPSHLPALDNSTGGYRPGTVTIVRSRDIEPENVQDFVISQIKQVCVMDDYRTLIISLNMNMREFARSMAYGENTAMIEKMYKAPLYISQKDLFEDVNEHTLVAVLNEIFENESEPSRIVFIDGVDMAVSPKLIKDKCPDNSFLLELIKVAKKHQAAFVISDYDNKVETGLHRPDEAVEIELLTDIQDVVQAAIYYQKKEVIETDLYGLWRIFEKSI